MSATNIDKKEKEAGAGEKDVAENVSDEVQGAAAEAAAEGADAAEAEEITEAGKTAGEQSKEEKTPAGPDWKDLYARTLADFENFRKRTERDREDLAKFAAKEILKDLLATADNLALALEKAKDKDEPFVKGVQLVYDGFLKVLADHGATPLDSVGEPFDTAFHEALTQQPSDTVPEGHVMAEFKRGWLLNGKLLRAAQVVVSSGKPE
jgi:molecular chaperone GrpE